MAKTWEVGIANKTEEKNYSVTMKYIILFPKKQHKKGGETQKEIMEKLNTYKK